MVLLIDFVLLVANDVRLQILPDHLNKTNTLDSEFHGYKFYTGLCICCIILRKVAGDLSAKFMPLVSILYLGLCLFLQLIYFLGFFNCDDRFIVLNGYEYLQNTLNVL
ncbi:hypothetical protein PIB30_051870 [Stylosanthes scabra]|uniref:Uncharacterized protein n=1 Tax=Stylosanthes scabra TaxID=79078 RepID=A0ABU6SIK9_9FABA|nr:hypothetical protein [Stylosanthes scabra]